jgi:hypothetical protein
MKKEERKEMLKVRTNVKAGAPKSKTCYGADGYPVPC